MKHTALIALAACVTACGQPSLLPEGVDTIHAPVTLDTPADGAAVSPEAPDDFQVYWDLTGVIPQYDPHTHGMFPGLIDPLASHRYAQQIHCLAINIYHEARGSSYDDQVATAMVVLNRVASSRYPNTPCQVVYEPFQFSWTHDRISDYPDNVRAWVKAQQIAVRVFDREYSDITQGATHYHAGYVDPFWNKAGYQKQTIGAHTYMKIKGGR